jgi:hypothetical protein
VRRALADTPKNSTKVPAGSIQSGLLGAPSGLGARRDNRTPPGYPSSASPQEVGEMSSALPETPQVRSGLVFVAGISKPPSLQPAAIA